MPHIRDPTGPNQSPKMTTNTPKIDVYANYGHKSEAAFQGQLITAGDATAKLPSADTKKALIAAYME